MAYTCSKSTIETPERTLREICSKLIKSSEWLHEHCSGAFIVNFEQILHIVLLFPLVALSKFNANWVITAQKKVKSSLNISLVFMRKSAFRRYQLFSDKILYDLDFLRPWYSQFIGLMFHCWLRTCIFLLEMHVLPLTLSREQ